jgi:hypothetical protein
MYVCSNETILSSSSSREEFYGYKILFWAPWKFYEDCKVNCPKCCSSANVSNNGAYSKVKVVYDHEEVYYIVTWRFCCNNRECFNDKGKKSSFLGWDPKVVSQMDDCYRALFPATLIGKGSAIDNKLLSRLVSCIVSRETFHNFAIQLENAYRESFLIKGNHYLSWCLKKKKSYQTQLDNVNARLVFESFGDFDGEDFKGRSPSPRFLICAFLHAASNTEKFMDSFMRILSPEGSKILKGDATKKIVRCILKNGKQVYDSIYTVMNGENMILGQYLTRTSSLEELKGALEDLKKRFEELGISLDDLRYYTDNCCIDRGVLEKVFPTLLSSVQANESNELNNNITEFAIEEPYFWESLLSAEQACGAIAAQEPTYIGFDIEWPMNSGKPSILQICTADSQKAHVFQLSKFSEFPKSMKMILEDPSILKVGRNIKNDQKKLLEHFNVHVENVLDIGKMQKISLS